MKHSQAEFLRQLQAEAHLQARLHQQRLLPAKIDGLTRLIGEYPWQFLLILSGSTAVVFELFAR